VVRLLAYSGAQVSASASESSPRALTEIAGLAFPSRSSAFDIGSESISFCIRCLIKNARRNRVGFEAFPKVSL
jgi:hypothetical protein